MLNLPRSTERRVETLSEGTLTRCSIAMFQLALMAACSEAPFPSPVVSVLASSPAASTRVDRTAQIPVQATKMQPGIDEHPPEVYTDEYQQPVPVPGRINTAGAEDSPFISPDGKTLYFFFTPDVNVPVQEQVRDGVTGIYMSRLENAEWTAPARVALEDPGTAAGDGCELVRAEVMWFCSVREGYTGVHWFSAEYQNGRWQDWKLEDFDPEYQVGEFHISPDGTALYFGSGRPGGRGGLDIWVSHLAGGVWQEPINIFAVNTDSNEGWPALNPTGDELWFTRDYGVWRSRNVNGEWHQAELVVSPLAGEPSVDSAGNVYFVHHFFTGDSMVEADIYVAYKR
jgi:hypothetical protein